MKESSLSGNETIPTYIFVVVVAALSLSCNMWDLVP